MSDIILEEQAASGTPSTGQVVLYTKSDGLLYSKDDSGTELGVTGGEWITPTFAAGDFTGDGSQTWTVSLGDRFVHKYKIDGKTMTMDFDIETTTVGGTPATQLRILVPAGKTISGTTQTTCLISDNGAATAVGIVTAGDGGGSVVITKIDNSNWTAATDATRVRGQITFGIA